MKRVTILLCALAALTANARPAETEGSLEYRLAAGLTRSSAALSKGAKPNEIVKGKITYSGIAVQLLTTDNPLQLVNPVAPAKYGAAEDNLLRDSTHGWASGLTLFSIRF
jgi:hypothetical protein